MSRLQRMLVLIAMEETSLSDQLISQWANGTSRIPMPAFSTSSTRKAPLIVLKSHVHGHARQVSTAPQKISIVMISPPPILVISFFLPRFLHSRIDRLTLPADAVRRTFDVPLIGSRTFETVHHRLALARFALCFLGYGPTASTAEPFGAGLGAHFDFLAGFG